MIGNHQGTKCLLSCGDDRHILFRRRVMRQDEIDLIGDQSGNQFVGGADAHIESDIWMLRPGIA